MTCQFFSLRHLYADSDSHPQRRSRPQAAVSSTARLNPLGDRLDGLARRASWRWIRGTGLGLPRDGAAGQTAHGRPSLRPWAAFIAPSMDGASQAAPIAAGNLRLSRADGVSVNRANGPRYPGAGRALSAGLQIGRQAIGHPWPNLSPVCRISVENHSIALGYEFGGQEFESLRARHFVIVRN